MTLSLKLKLSLLITGNLKFAGGIASTEMVTKIILYYLHERVWHFIPWGRQIELQPAIGNTGPK